MQPGLRSTTLYKWHSQKQGKGDRTWINCKLPLWGDVISEIVFWFSHFWICSFPKHCWEHSLTSVPIALRPPNQTQTPWPAYTALPGLTSAARLIFQLACLYALVESNHMAVFFFFFFLSTFKPLYLPYTCLFLSNLSSHLCTSFCLSFRLSCELSFSSLCTPTAHSAYPLHTQSHHLICIPSPTDC